METLPTPEPVSDRHGPDRHGPAPVDPPSTTAWAIAATSAGAGAIHLSAAPSHTADSVVLGVGFVAVAWFQFAIAAGSITRPDRRWYLANVAGTAAILAAWVVSRTAGLPLGSHTEPEAVGLADAVCVALQLVSAVLSASLLRTASPAPRRAGWTVSPAVPVLGAALLATGAIAAPGGVGGHDHTGGTGHEHEEVELASGHGHDDDHEVASGPSHDDDHDAGTGGHDHDATAATGGDDHGHDPTADDHHGTSTAAAPHAHAAAGATTATSDGHDHAATGAEATTDAPHEHGDPDAGDHHGTDGPSTDPDTSGHHHPVCTAPVTPEQEAAAAVLLTASRAEMARYEDLDAAKADGFVPITPTIRGLVHYGHFGRMSDGVHVDPTRIESLIYATRGDGTWYLVGGMYWQDDPAVAPPQPGGCLTTWHNHTNLCIAPGQGMVGVVDSRGRCPAGSRNEPTAQMLHVWYVDLPSGPFSELDEANPAAIRAGVIATYFG